MTRKWKIIIAVIAAAVVLSLAGGAVALAADPPASTSNPYIAAVAAKLGVSEADLTAAMKQARQELAASALDQALQKAIEQKLIDTTEAQAIRDWLAKQPAVGDAAAMKAWWDARPKLANDKVYRGYLWMAKFARQWGWCHGNLGIIQGNFLKKVAEKLNKPEQVVKDAFQTAAKEMQAARFEKALSNAVTNGKLTQEEADQIKGWWAQKPAALDKFLPDGGFGGMMKRFGGRGGCGPLQNSSPWGSTQTSTNTTN